MATLVDAGWDLITDAGGEGAEGAEQRVAVEARRVDAEAQARREAEQRAAEAEAELARIKAQLER